MLQWGGEGAYPTIPMKNENEKHRFCMNRSILRGQIKNTPAFMEGQLPLLNAAMLWRQPAVLNFDVSPTVSRLG